MKQYIRCLMFPLLCFLCLDASVMGLEYSVVTPEEVGLSTPRLEKLRNAIQIHVDREELAGAVTLVARRGKIAHFEAYGWLDVQTKRPMPREAIFRIASMAKPITSIAVLILYEDDRFSLTDPVSKFIPELRHMNVAVFSGNDDLDQVSLNTVPANREITIQDLLRHTSGLTYGGGYPSLDKLYEKADLRIRDIPSAEFVKNLSELPLAFHPGTRWEYSYSTDVLGYLVEIISGQRLDRFIKERIFEPLGMKDTGYFVPDDKLDRLTTFYEYKNGQLETIESAASSSYRFPPEGCPGGGYMVSTVSDYYRLSQMVLNGGVLDGRRLLGRKTVELMTTNHLRSIPREQWYKPYAGFGLGVAVLDDIGTFGELGTPGMFWWKGYYNTYFFIDPVEELIGIIMMPMLPYRHLNLMYRFKDFCMQAIVD